MGCRGDEVASRGREREREALTNIPCAFVNGKGRGGAGCEARGKCLSDDDDDDDDGWLSEQGNRMQINEGREREEEQQTREQSIVSRACICECTSVCESVLLPSRAGAQELEERGAGSACDANAASMDRERASQSKGGRMGARTRESERERDGALVLPSFCDLSLTSLSADARHDPHCPSSGDASRGSSI